MVMIDTNRLKIVSTSSYIVLLRVNCPLKFSLFYFIKYNIYDQYTQFEKKLYILFLFASTDVDLLDNVTHLSFVEELLDVNTTFACEKLFDYVEKRKAKITVVSLYIIHIKYRYINSSIELGSW